MFGEDDDDSPFFFRLRQRRQLREIIAAANSSMVFLLSLCHITQFGICALNREIGGVLGNSLLSCFGGFLEQGGASFVRSQRSSTQEHLHAPWHATVGLNLRN